MLSLDESPTSPETPFYKTRGNFRLNALEEAFLTFRSQSDRSERERERLFFVRERYSLGRQVV